MNFLFSAMIFNLSGKFIEQKSNCSSEAPVSSKSEGTWAVTIDANKQKRTTDDQVIYELFKIVFFNKKV